MRHLLFAVLITLVNVGFAAVLIPCPKMCKCEYGKNTLEAKCTSQKFLHKIDDKQAAAFQSLDLRNTSIKVLDKRLKILVNLKKLDLSDNQMDNIVYFPALSKLETLSLARNKLKDISFSSLPKALKDLDLSSNHIIELPKDWQHLHHLSTLHIHNNPIKCDENSINKFVNLVSLKISIPENVMCYSPKNSHGKKLQSLIADVLLNPMLGDQDVTTETDEDDDQSEFIKHTTEKSEQLIKNIQENLFDGSGDEGSGDVDIVSSPCVIDCSTFKPLEVLRDNNTSPLLSIKEQVNILFEDLFGKEQDEPSTTLSTIISDKLSTPVEEVVSKKTVPEDMSEPKTTKNTEKLVVSATDGKDAKDLERASLSDEDVGNTYYLIGTIIILMIIVAIFIIIKKKSSNGKRKRRRNSMAENGICEEMKPLGKYKDITNGTSNEKPKEDELRPERIPLMNGQNGKSDSPASNKGSLENIDVTLRTPLENGGSSPKPERVTITASEIPPTILKTPQLVHRELNSDGKIITKPLDDSY